MVLADHQIKVRRESCRHLLWTSSYFI